MQVELGYRVQSLSFRQERNLTEPKLSAPSFRPISRSVIFLVHGYNVNPGQAGKGYDTFLSHLMASGRLSASHAICQVHWPGDHGPLVAYHLNVPRAITSAALFRESLEEYLRASPSANPDITIIAHSLGSRVTLELINTLRFMQPDSQLRIILMSAAVPVNSQLMDGIRTQVALGVKKTTRWVCLFSSIDPVLRFAFPAGELLAGARWFPVAIGLRGNPPGFWGGGSQDALRSHGEYWSERDIAECIEMLLTKGTLPRLEVRRKVSAWRDLPSNSIPDRNIPHRTN